MHQTENRRSVLVPTMQSSNEEERQSSATPGSSKWQLSFGPAQRDRTNESVILSQLLRVLDQKRLIMCLLTSAQTVFFQQDVPKSSLKYANSAVVEMIKESFFAEFEAIHSRQPIRIFCRSWSGRSQNRTTSYLERRSQNRPQEAGWRLHSERGQEHIRPSRLELFEEAQ